MSAKQKSEIIISNKIARPKAPILSIVSPTFRYDPYLLLDKLKSETISNKNLANIEVIVIDDGSGDDALIEKIKSQLDGFNVSTTLIALETNKGRSFARNRLIEFSRGGHILFLDSDMLPDSDDFISKWLELIERTDPTIAYGGFTMLSASKDNKYALARALAQSSDCLSAAERSLRGPIAVATSNLLVRRDVMAAIPFDCGFVGWGWEDVDWALRASANNYAVAHVEIPATHLGLDEDKTILEKFAKAGPNFKHITSRHPEMQLLMSTKTAMLASKMPFLKLAVKPVYTIATNTIFPLKLRALSARIYRALWAAISIRGN